MKITKLSNILLVFIFALFLFQGDEVGARSKGGYDIQIKSDIAQIRNAMELCWDNNKESYSNCGNLELIGASNIKPPICSDDKEYNIVISEDGSDDAIFGDLCEGCGYWCFDSTGTSKNVVSDEIPTKENAVCPEDSNYSGRNENSNNCQQKENAGDFLHFLIILIVSFIIAFNLVMLLFNKNKFKYKYLLMFIFKMIITILLLISYIPIINSVIIDEIIEFDGNIIFIIFLLSVLLISTYLLYMFIKYLLIPYKKEIFSLTMLFLEILILSYILIFIYAVIFLN